MCGRGYAMELRIELLTSEDATAYLAGSMGGAVSTRLAALVYERTEGHALFLVNIVEHLVSQRVIVHREERWTLQDGSEAKVASVAGEQFTVAAVAAGARAPVADVEASCERLAVQGRFLQDIGLREWADGT